MPTAAGNFFDGTEAIRSLFDTEICCAWSDAPDPEFELLADELAVTAAMTPARLAEFRNGRRCARRVLQALGYPQQPVPAGAGRAPVWPADVTGSIAHHGSVAVAVAAGKASLAGIGIDIESHAAVDADLVAMIATPDELALFGSEPAASKLVFSLKESLFKCVWPSVGRYFDFADVSLSAAAGAIRAVPSGFPADEAALFEALELRYTTWNGLILSAAFIAAGGAIDDP